MAYIDDAPRVAETTTTTGTGALALAGAYDASRRTFSSVCSTSDTVPYFIVADDDQWEHGLGTYSAADELTRTTVYASSNAGSVCTLTAGTKVVFLGDPGMARSVLFAVNKATPVAADRVPLMDSDDSNTLKYASPDDLGRGYTDAAIAAITGNQAGGTTGIVSGGNYAWTTGLSYLVSAATYLINGVSYASAETTITLDAADATYDRFDLIVLDTAGTVQKITGTPAAAPSEPSYDPTSQLKLTLVAVGANATEPVGADSEVVYEEAGSGEWTDTTSGSGINSASTSGPRTGTTCIEATSAGNGAYVQLERDTASSLSTMNTLGLYLKSKAQFSSGRALKVQFFLNGVAKGNALVIASQAISSFGFDTANTATWQFVSIPIAQFVLPAGATVNQLRITAVNSGTGWRVDDVSLSNSGTVIVNTSSGISEEAADARYEKLTSKDVSGGYVGKTLEKINFWNAARTFKSFLVNAATAARTYTFPDKDLTVAGIVDITAANAGLGNVTNDAQTKAAIVPNTAPSAGEVLVGNAGGTAYAKVAISGDGALSSAGALTVKPTECIPIACSDETTALTTGTAKVTFRMPYPFTLSAVRASVTTAPTGGTLLTVDINESGTTILSTKLTFDASEKTTTTAATAAVISDSSLADDSEITIDIDAVGSTIAGAGLKVYLIGKRT